MSGTMVPMTSTRLTLGRSSVSGITATIFGASGFLGKYVCNRFGKVGSKCVLPYRGDEMDVRHLKLTGDLGVINPIESSIRSLDDIEAAVAGSNVVINLLGKHFETSRWSFADIHGTFPSVLATVCAEQGVERFVHVSALGAAHDAPSAYARSKMVGDEAVRGAFPEATILRPATIFGDEDRFLNRIAKLTQLLPLYPMGSDAAAAKQQPVYCDDVAAAVFHAATQPGCQGKTYDLAGPKVYTNEEIMDYVFDLIKEEPNLVITPPGVARGVAAGLQLIPNPWMTLDGVRRISSDVTLEAEGVVNGLAELGVDQPVALEEVADRYLRRFRKMSSFIEGDEVVSQPR